MVVDLGTLRCWFLASLAVGLAFGLVSPLSGQPSSTDVASAESAPATVEQCQPSAKLAWRAKAETGIYGYLVYRSADRQGPFVRRNQAIVKAEGVDENGVGQYVFVDCEVEAGKTYYYYLDYVTNTGLKVRFSGVQTKTIASGE